MCVCFTSSVPAFSAACHVNKGNLRRRCSYSGLFLLTLTHTHTHAHAHTNTHTLTHAHTHTGWHVDNSSFWRGTFPQLSLLFPFSRATSIPHRALQVSRAGPSCSCPPAHLCLLDLLLNLAVIYQLSVNTNLCVFSPPSPFFFFFFSPSPFPDAYQQPLKLPMKSSYLRALSDLEHLHSFSRGIQNNNFKTN